MLRFPSTRRGRLLAAVGATAAVAGLSWAIVAGLAWRKAAACERAIEDPRLYFYCHLGSRPRGV
mgnify:CR=1 FL=1